MDEIVKEFLIESNENLDRLDQELVKLESDPSSKELLASIFRTIHTIKGTCGFLGFPHLQQVAHAGESLLSRLRDGELTLTAEIASGLLDIVDAVRRMLGEIQSSGHDGDDDHTALIERLTRLLNPIEPAAPPESAPLALAPAEAAKTESAQPRHSLSPADLAELCDPNKIGGVLLEQGRLRPEDLALALEEQEKGRRKLGEILIAQGVVRPEDVISAQRTLESRNPQAAIETIRVGVTLLDRLMNLVGELVLARNQLLQFSNACEDASFQALSQRMNLIASELQEEVMRTRMQPIGNLWNKFPRTVRDLAVSCGKEVRIEMEGNETELDRTIIEAIKDPLTHLVRNAIDHGIELPEVRAKGGKPVGGCLSLRAFHEGGHVNIEISDDGAGLNRERIRAKAIERGLVSSDQATVLADRDICNLIFQPGFSTAEKVTNVSGRGVGLDVVKTNVEKIGGTVNVQSTPGQGTTVRVKIPLTLAIIPALLVKCQGERFAIPQVSLTELVRLESGKGIEQVHGAAVYRLRGRLLPLVFLREQLRREPAPGAGHPGTDDAPVNIAVLQAGGSTFGLVVDEIVDTQEIVVKPLGRPLKNLKVYSGATIMGDGKVALILDVAGVAQRGSVLAEVRPPRISEAAKTAGEVQTTNRCRSWLLLENKNKLRLAISLSSVARLEEFPAANLERSGGQEAIQYRGEIMPLIRLSRFLDGEKEHTTPTDDPVQVVVYSEHGRTTGLIVDRIIDIAEGEAVVQPVQPRPGISGSFVIQQRITELLDVPQIVRAVNCRDLARQQGGTDAG